MSGKCSNETQAPRGNELRPHIGIFGRRNVGKSSLINYVTGQQAAIVSNTPGTTTDPVRKGMELIGIGPVVWIDTAGIDDEGMLGQQRIERSYEVLPGCDLALLLFTADSFGEHEHNIVSMCEKHGVPLMLICTKTDIMPLNDVEGKSIESKYNRPVTTVCTNDATGREPLCKLIANALPESSYRHSSLLGDVVRDGDHVVMVTPIDSAAPEGRMILPQVQVLRDLLDSHAFVSVCQVEELENVLGAFKERPRLVITDSQAFSKVSTIVPNDVYLTSFSVVLARAKGLFKQYVEGTPHIDQLQDGDRVALLESCTHNVTCEDIGRVKLPKLLSKHTGKRLEFDVVSGLTQMPRPIGEYSLVIQCGGCVVTPKQLYSRLAPALENGIPVSNYGLALAYMNGIFERSMKVFRIVKSE